MIPQPALVIMAHHPTPGRVKTKLQPAYTEAQSAEIERIFLLHFIERLEALKVGRVVVCFDPPTAQDAFLNLLGHDRLDLLPQECGDLGARLAACAKMLGQKSYEHVIFFGVDSPDVPDALIYQLASLLGPHPVALGPTDDGGFWGLGLTTSLDLVDLLNNIEWSSGRELAQLVEKFNCRSLPVGLADQWSDVVRPEDLTALVERLQRSSDVADRALLDKLTPALSRDGALT